MFDFINTDISIDKEWNNFLSEEYNLFYDYRFLKYNDKFNKNINWHHLKIRDKERKKIIGIINGCEEIIDNKKKFISCNGVSFGGFLWSGREDVIEYINAIKYFKKYLRDNNFHCCIIRNSPNIYKNSFNEEYEYALLHEGFSVSNNSITNIVDLNDFEFSKLSNPKKRGIRKSSQNIEVKILEDKLTSENFSSLYKILKENREEKNVVPTHSLEELIYLKNNLKDEIIIFYAEVEKTAAGICILFKVKSDVILNFYLAADKNFKKERVSDYILFSSIEWAKKNNFRLYDIGTSNIKTNLLEGLFTFKKKFMADGFLRKTFEIELK